MGAICLLNYWIMYNYCFFYECSWKVTSSLFRTNVCICDMFYIWRLWKPVGICWTKIKIQIQLLSWLIKLSMWQIHPPKKYYFSTTPMRHTLCHSRYPLTWAVGPKLVHTHWWKGKSCLTRNLTPDVHFIRSVTDVTTPVLSTHRDIKWLIYSRHYLA
jgi:hypothetical protein